MGTDISPGKRPGNGDLDGMVDRAVFGDGASSEAARQRIREEAAARGILPASIQGLYEAAGKGLYQGMSVPAINIRGITYHVARAVFRAAKKLDVGAFIFEIARSEIGYTRQRPAEYAACVLAAAIREGYRGPLFLQGDHFQANRSRYAEDPNREIQEMADLVREAVDAQFLNIDIDASTLVELGRPTLQEQQEQNCMVTAQMTRLIRNIEPAGVTISVGGEIGEIGSGNSTPDDLRAFMAGYRSRLPSGHTGISKVSVQTGTVHGGVVLPDGNVAEVDLDFDTLGKLSALAREQYGLCGAVQHGASTLPDSAFDMFPKAGAAEVHLATGFQNIIYDSPHFPPGLRREIYPRLMQKYAGERKAGETDDQLIYKTRKRGFGDFKREMWGIPEENLSAIRGELEERFSFLFHKLNVTGSTDLVSEFVTGPGTAT